MSKGKLIEVELTQREINKLIFAIKKDMKISGRLLKQLMKARDEKRND